MKEKSDLEFRLMELKRELDLIIQGFKEEMKDFVFKNKQELYQIYKESK